MAESLPPAQTPESDTLDCPSCRQTITYYDITGSSFYGCPHCHTFFEYEWEGPPKILTTFSDSTFKPALQVGQEGFLNNQFVRVVGIMQKKELQASDTWMEYVIWNPHSGYAQLAEYNGHWMYIGPSKNTHSVSKVDSRLEYAYENKVQYRLYHRYQSEVLQAVGEFDWNILEDEKLTASEYINPPYMLVEEKQDNEVNWYKATYLLPAQVVSAFGLAENDLAAPHGVGVIEPAFDGAYWQALKTTTGIALGTFMLLFFGFLIAMPPKTLLNQTYVTEADTIIVNMFKPIVTQSFAVDGPTSVNIEFDADIANQWIEVSASLINNQTGRAYEFTKALEYYYGVDQGERWSEGSTSETATLARIPDGTYHLNLYPASEQAHRLKVKVTRGSSVLLNGVLILVLLLVYPAFQFIHQRIFEQKRWSTSDYSDFNNE